MSVLIKGMEMPTGCAFCKIKRRNGKKMVCPFCDEEWDIHDPMSADYRLDNCPLAHVPPHGRLINADVLLGDLPVEYPSIVYAIETAPTIIPADKEYKEL